MLKVMVVDDTKNIRKLLTTCLEIQGHCVYVAENAKEALEILKKEDVNLAFIDIKMPEISGTELLKKIREKDKEILVVIMTAFPTVKNAVECTKMGAVAYLQKPFTSDRIKNLLVEIYETTKEREIEDIKKHISVSKKFIEEKKNDKALKVLKKALSINPTIGEIYYLIGKVYDAKSFVQEAEKFYAAAKLFDFKK